jgi:hypothetical protein
MNYEATYIHSINYAIRVSAAPASPALCLFNFLFIYMEIKNKKNHLYVASRTGNACSLSALRHFDHARPVRVRARLFAIYTYT